MEWEVTYRSLCNQFSLFFLSIFDQYLSIAGRLLQKKSLLATKNFSHTQKTLSKNLICDVKIKSLQILGKMWDICDQQKMVSPMMGKPIEPGGSFPL